MHLLGVILTLLSLSFPTNLTKTETMMLYKKQHFPKAFTKTETEHVYRLKYQESYVTATSLPQVIFLQALVFGVYF